MTTTAAHALVPLPTAVRPAAPAPHAPAPRFSLVIPVHDGGEAFRRCLESLPEAAPGELEIVVVDDASRDGSGELAAGRGHRVVRLDRRSGPAAARNAGAEVARGDWLFFLDADCLLHAEALAIAARAIDEEPGLVALFGSYDDRPEARGAVSQFKNLFHHWTHQRGAETARTFWAGCGAVRRSAFLAVGGFDAARYPEPSIEDIELGYRLSERGGRIRLLKRLQVRHLKRWTLRSWLATDLFRRGVPWTALLLEGRGRGGELNVGGRERLVVGAGGVATAALAAAAVPGWSAAALAVAALATATMIGFSRSFYALVRRRRGIAAATAAVPLHLLYCCCCVGAFALGTARHLVAGRRVPPPA